MTEDPGAHLDHPRIAEDPVRRAVEVRPQTQSVLDRGDPPLQVPHEGPGGEAQHVPVPIAVQRDRVAGRGDLPGQRGVPLHLLAAEEEGGSRVRRVEGLEHRGGPLGMRTVVEGDRRSLGVVDSPRQAEDAGDARHDGSERGSPPSGRGSGRR